MGGDIVEIVITKTNFEQEVVLSEKPVLLDFWAPWCAPCQMLSPVISEISEENQQKIKVGRVNVEEEDFLVEKFGIENVPTVILLKGGKSISSFVGFRSKEEIEDMIKKI